MYNFDWLTSSENQGRSRSMESNRPWVSNDDWLSVNENNKLFLNFIIFFFLGLELVFLIGHNLLHKLQDGQFRTVVFLQFVYPFFNDRQRTLGKRNTNKTWIGYFYFHLISAQIRVGAPIKKKMFALEYQF